MPPKRNAKSSKKAGSGARLANHTAVRVGAGAAAIGALTWLTGGLSWQNAIEWMKALAVAGGLALMIRWSVGEPFRIPSNSMWPTLNGDERFLRGDRVWVNKFVYGLRFPLNNCRIPFTNYILRYADDRIFHSGGPQRFDIVVFKTVEPGAKNRILVKRVIGLPGERIHIADGKVYVNGEPLALPDCMPPNTAYTSSTPYSMEPMRYGILKDDAYSVVPPNHYLLLGDNSEHSRDGRYWGWVPNENILGRVASIWWPIPRWRDFTGFSATWWWRALVTVLGVLLVVRLFLGRSWRAPKAGLGQPIQAGDHLYINRCAFGLPIPFTRRRVFEGRAPRRGELVLYRVSDPDQSDHEMALGWVAGLPGERVRIEDGHLTINGAPITEPAGLASRTFASPDGVGPYGASSGRQYAEVPDGQYYVLVEEPGETPDSRALGWIRTADLVGPATAIWWPIARWRRLRP